MDQSVEGDIKTEDNTGNCIPDVDKDNPTKEDDPYHYTKRGEFTSELFKICVENLPYYVGYQVSIRKFYEEGL